MITGTSEAVLRATSITYQPQKKTTTEEAAETEGRQRAGVPIAWDA